MICPSVTQLLSLIGLTFEIVGVVFMARKVTNVLLWQIPRVLISALWRGNIAKDVAGLAAFTPDDDVYFLQGLSFVALGFVIQTASLFVHI